MQEKCSSAMHAEKLPGSGTFEVVLECFSHTPSSYIHVWLVGCLVVIHSSVVELAMMVQARNPRCLI